jgi:hypothetical protein
VCAFLERERERERESSRKEMFHFRDIEKREKRERE